MTSVDFVAHGAELLTHVAGVVHVVSDGLAYLLLAFGGIYGLGGTLGDVACAVELGALAAVPHRVELLAVVYQFFGDYGVAAAYSCEACGLGVAAEFDGAAFGSFDFVDGVWYIGVLNICFVGCVEEDKAALGQCVVDPYFKLLVGEYGACGIVGIAEIDDVNMVRWQLWDEVVAGGHGHECDVAPVSVDVLACATCHDIAVYVDGIYGVGDSDSALGREYVADVAAVAFGSVADEDFVNVEFHSARCIIVGDDGFAEEIVALLGTVASEGGGLAHLVDGLVHGCDTCLGKGLCDIAYAEADDVHLGIFCLEGFDFAGNVGEEITALQLLKIMVYHRAVSF